MSWRTLAVCSLQALVFVGAEAQEPVVGVHIISRSDGTVHVFHDKALGLQLIEGTRQQISAAVPGSWYRVIAKPSKPSRFYVSEP